jgi:hypothetical protein
MNTVIAEVDGGIAVAVAAGTLKNTLHSKVYLDSHPPLFGQVPQLTDSSADILHLIFQPFLSSPPLFVLPRLPCSLHERITALSLISIPLLRPPDPKS